MAHRLIEIREREQLSMRAMADAIGVNVAYLHHALHGKVGVGRKMLDGAIRAYPELADVYARSLTIRHKSTSESQRISVVDDKRCDPVPDDVEVAV